MQATLKRLNERRSQDNGFTLIELLVVIVILGILAAVVVFAVGGIADRGEESACEATSKAVETAAEAFYAQNSAYPVDIEAMDPTFLRLDDDMTQGGTDPNWTIQTDGGTVTYNSGTGAVTNNCT